MKKIPTLFIRKFHGKGKVTILNEVMPGCEWVLQGEGIATRKWDGSCCAVIDGKFWKRYDAKKGKPIPENAILCQPKEDAITGHLPCWIPVNNKSEDKWFRVALENAGGLESLVDGTYEAVGPHFNSNHENYGIDTLIKHGKGFINVERTFEGIKAFLERSPLEGIVFHRLNGEMCKIKRSDFGLEWPVKQTKII